MTTPSPAAVAAPLSAADQSAPHAPLPLFEQDGNRFVPTRAGRGYWQEGTLNGSAVAALTGWVIERDFGEDGLIPVRFCVDMLRMAPSEPLEVTTEAIHDGHRLKLIEARIVCGGKLVTRATCQFIRATQQPENPIWSTPAWDVPHPDTLPTLHRFTRWDARPIPADHARIARHAPPGGDAAHGNVPVLGDISAPERRQVWLKPLGEIVAGHALSPFMRVVVTGDFASPLTHSSRFGIDFVNTDFTAYLHRLPQGEWLGYELTGHLSEAGVAVGECRLHDLAGPVGTINVAAAAQVRRKKA
ncbi:thioesterase family protein [Novosphingobium olei]|uniref:Thioesterase family protein n=1 Tax=Novosphingobium olei TaxID=2728851 RepID=A0A7Y0GC97_9SPHN|nr:thioesterase family protein [Novosphingobium olei]NML95814.1 thioesterase family protein [Novosphingobium olei]